MRFGHMKRCPPTRGSLAHPSEGDGDTVGRPSRFAVGTEVAWDSSAAPDEETHPGSRAGRTRVAVVSGAGDVTELTHQGLWPAATDVEDLLRAPTSPSQADRTKLREVMSREVVCVRPDLDAALLLPLLTALDVKALTVVDGAGHPVGMVSRADALEPRALRETVEDVMVSMPFMLRETVSLSRAAALMAYEEVHRLPVVSAERLVVGVISALDVARWVARNDGYVVPAPAVAQPARFDFLLRIAAALASTREQG